MSEQDTTSAVSDQPTAERQLRLWPGVALVALLWLVRFGVPAVAPEATAIGLMGGLAGVVAVLAWWLVFSRAPRAERWGVLALMVVAMVLTVPLLDASIATGGMGLVFPFFATPVLCLGLVAWAVATRNVRAGARRAALVVIVAVACGGWTLVRTGGFTGDFDHDFAWRWAPTPEQRLLAEAEGEPLAPPTPDEIALEGASSVPARWPAFRGPDRDGVVHGVRVVTDWTASPPVELWRRRIGPGWSSFAVGGDVFYTQEQRGDEELVVCHDLETGRPIWRHRDEARFWESNAGAGPRATPTLHGGRVHTLGATGILNALDARSGEVVWSRDVATDTGIEVPMWAFSSSPLVAGDLVIVAAAGTLAAYDVATGEPRWAGPTDDKGYSSPHPVTIAGVEQIVLQSSAGATSVAPTDGTVLWQYTWAGEPIVQPARIGDGDLLLNAGDRSGLRRIAVTHDEDEWTVEDRWESIRLKPNHNDFVVHGGHAYGFDGSRLACVDLVSGKRAWKGGSYGHGQLVLLADQSVLLVLSEEGEIALVAATPDGYEELARTPAIESKTWNHPVLVGDVLLVRNGEEMAAFRLALEGA